MRNLKIPLILVALVGLIALAGCGGDDSTTSTTEATSTATDSTATESTSTTETTTAASSDYGQQLTSILTDFGTAFQSLGSSLQSVKDKGALASGINDLETQIQTTITDLNALEPPPEAQAGQDQLVTSFEDLSTKLTEVSDAVDSGDKQAASTAAQDLQTAAASFQTDFGAGLKAIADSGVQVGPATGG